MIWTIGWLIWGGSFLALEGAALARKQRGDAKRLEAEVATQLAELGETTEKQMRVSVDKVIGEFDKLGVILLGTDRAEPLEEMVRKVAAMPGRHAIEPYDAKATYDVDVLEVPR